jgi:hypothetical protein
MSHFERDYDLIRNCFLWSLVPSPIKAVVLCVILLIGWKLFGHLLFETDLLSVYLTIFGEMSQKFFSILNPFN